MTPRKLQNYIRTHRKRAGWSQDEVAYLLGFKGPSNVSRYETFQRMPDFETALACEVIFGLPIRELFAGLYEKVEKKTMRRVETLARRIANAPEDKFTHQKLAALGRAVRNSSPRPDA